MTDAEDDTLEAMRLVFEVARRWLDQRTYVNLSADTKGELIALLRKGAHLEFVVPVTALHGRVELRAALVGGPYRVLACEAFDMRERVSH
jgi:hypothetical protein